MHHGNTRAKKLPNKPFTGLLHLPQSDTLLALQYRASHFALPARITLIIDRFEHCMLFLSCCLSSRESPSSRANHGSGRKTTAGWNTEWWRRFLRHHSATTFECGSRVLLVHRFGRSRHARGGRKAQENRLFRQWSVRGVLVRRLCRRHRSTNTNIHAYTLRDTPCGAGKAGLVTGKLATTTTTCRTTPSCSCNDSSGVMMQKGQTKQQNRKFSVRCSREVVNFPLSQATISTTAAYVIHASDAFVTHITIYQPGQLCALCTEQLDAKKNNPSTSFRILRIKHQSVPCIVATRAKARLGFATLFTHTHISRQKDTQQTNTPQVRD